MAITPDTVYIQYTQYADSRQRMEQKNHLNGGGGRYREETRPYACLFLELSCGKRNGIDFQIDQHGLSGSVYLP